MTIYLAIVYNEVKVILTVVGLQDRWLLVKLKCCVRASLALYTSCSTANVTFFIVLTLFLWQEWGKRRILGGFRWFSVVVPPRDPYG